MNIQDCPRFGRHCITLRAALNAPAYISIPSESMINKLPFELSHTLVELTPMSAVMDLLMHAEKTLSALHGHPLDTTVIGIETSGLAQLQLLVARKEDMQKRTDASNVAEVAAQEVALIREMSSRIKPLVEKIQQNTATAEEAMKLLLAENNPAHARKVLMAHLQAVTTVMQDLEVVTSSGDEPGGSSCLVKGRKPHQLRIEVLSIDREKSICVVRVVKCDSHSELFKRDDLGQQSLRLSVHDQDSFFVLCQCAALGVPLSVVVSVDVSITSKCFLYRAALLSVPDKATLLQKLKEQMISRTTDMFGG